MLRRQMHDVTCPRVSQSWIKQTPTWPVLALFPNLSIPFLLHIPQTGVTLTARLVLPNSRKRRVSQ
jgi:hypothetical protein